MAKDRIQNRKITSKAHYDRGVYDINLAVGDRVMVKNHVRHGKYDMLYRGPCTIVAIPTDKTIKYKDGTKIKTTNRDFVKRDSSSRTVDVTDDDRPLINLINTF